MNSAPRTPMNLKMRETANGLQQEAEEVHRELHAAAQAADDLALGRLARPAATCRSDSSTISRSSRNPPSVLTRFSTTNSIAIKKQVAVREDQPEAVAACRRGASAGRRGGIPAAGALAPVHPEGQAERQQQAGRRDEHQGERADAARSTTPMLAPATRAERLRRRRRAETAACRAPCE